MSFYKILEKSVFISLIYFDFLGRERKDRLRAGRRKMVGSELAAEGWSENPLLEEVSTNLLSDMVHA